MARTVSEVFYGLYIKTPSPQEADHQFGLGGTNTSHIDFLTRVAVFRRKLSLDSLLITEIMTIHSWQS
jgi:hypothetical protein